MIDPDKAEQEPSTDREVAPPREMTLGEEIETLGERFPRIAEMLRQVNKFYRVG